MENSFNLELNPNNKKESKLNIQNANNANINKGAFAVKDKTLVSKKYEKKDKKNKQTKNSDKLNNSNGKKDKEKDHNQMPIDQLCFLKKKRDNDIKIDFCRTSTIINNNNVKINKDLLTSPRSNISLCEITNNQSSSRSSNLSNINNTSNYIQTRLFSNKINVSSIFSASIKSNKRNTSNRKRLSSISHPMENNNSLKTTTNIINYNNNNNNNFIINNSDPSSLQINSDLYRKECFKNIGIFTSDTFTMSKEVPFSSQNINNNISVHFFSTKKRACSEYDEFSLRDHSCTDNNIFSKANINNDTSKNYFLSKQQVCDSNFNTNYNNKTNNNSIIYTKNKQNTYNYLINSNTNNKYNKQMNNSANWNSYPNTVSVNSISNNNKTKDTKISSYFKSNGPNTSNSDQLTTNLYSFNNPQQLEEQVNLTQYNLLKSQLNTKNSEITKLKQTISDMKLEQESTNCLLIDLEEKYKKAIEETNQLNLLSEKYKSLSIKLLKSNETLNKKKQKEELFNQCIKLGKPCDKYSNANDNWEEGKEITDIKNQLSLIYKQKEGLDKIRKEVNNELSSLQNYKKSNTNQNNTCGKKLSKLINILFYYYFIIIYRNSRN